LLHYSSKKPFLFKDSIELSKLMLHFHLLLLPLLAHFVKLLLQLLPTLLELGSYFFDLVLAEEVLTKLYSLSGSK
jgi:hypothetical protein